jgi:CheY-like chemotaxis protein
MAKTILLADDSATIRKIVELTFSGTEFRLQTAESGEQALAALESEPPDLVLADVVMPGPDGYELCSTIKTSDRPVPVILLAGTFEPFDAERASACGADAHLVKPFESEGLLAKVKELLAPLEEKTEADEPVTEGEPSDETAGEPVETPAATPPADEIIEPVEPGGTKPAEGARTEPVQAPPELVDAVARAVIERLSADVVREIAWEVVPDLAAVIIRERIRDLEKD